MTIKALVIDDEPLAHEIIKKYTEGLNSIDIIGYCSDALEGINVLNERQVDLIFLDVNMPKLSGIDFLKTLKNPPLVILTTAYTEYAIESFELNVLDYLTKPFSMSRFLMSIQKAEKQLMLIQSNSSSEKIHSIFIKSNKKTYQIQLTDILFVEGLGDYINIFTEKAHWVTNLSMKKMQELLPQTEFFRVHKSYIINLKKIISIDGNLVELPTKKIVIGNNFRQEFFARIGNTGN